MPSPPRPQLQLTIAAALALALATPACAEGVGIVRINVTARMAADRSVTTETHIEMKALSPAALSTIAQIPVSYTEGQKVRVIAAYTSKPDGSIVQANPADFTTQNGSVGPSTSFSDVRIKEVPFRNVDVGDTTVITVRTVEKKHFFPGQYSFFRIMNAPGFAQDIDYKLIVPNTIPITHNERGVAYTQKSSGGAIEREWKAHVFTPITREKDIVYFDGRVPNFGFSTFKSYGDLARTYYAAASKKAAVTDQVRKLADRITAGIIDPHAQAVAIFDWVSTHIRSVAIYFGAGRYVPNGAATILARRFGDCKDHVTLMSALFAAKGIASEQVLINTAPTSNLPAAPVVQAFNHVILYVPSLDAYADPTAPYSSFGNPPAVEGDSPIVRVSDKGAVITRTPVGTPDQNVAKIETHIVIDADGSRSGRTRIETTGFLANKMRFFVAQSETEGQERWLAQLAKGLGFNGVFDMSAPSSRNHSQPYVVKTKWKIAHAPSILQAGWRPPQGFSPLFANLSNFFGPIAMAPRKFPASCFPGKIIQDVSAKLPDGLRPVLLPGAIRQVNGPFSFTRIWRFSEGVLDVRSVFVSAPASRICQAKTINEAFSLVESLMGRTDPMLQFRTDWPSHAGSKQGVALSGNNP